MLEYLGAIVGVVAVWLTVREIVWCWPVGLVSLSAYVVVFGRERLYGSMGLQIVYIVLALYGWYEWTRGSGDAALRVSRAPRGPLATLFAGAILLSTILAAVLAHYTDATLPWIDAPLTGLSLFAQALQTRKWIENWGVWILVDAAYVGLYASQHLWSTAGLFLVYLVLAVSGLSRWRRSMAAA